MSSNNGSELKTFYIPYTCDHIYILAATLRAHGIPAETLSPPTDETLAIGLDVCKGRECLPCFTITGDILHRAKQPDFDPAQSVFMIPSTNGPCRFGQYRTLQRNILDEAGLHEMEIVSPNGGSSHQGFGDYQSLNGHNPGKLRALGWQGVVTVDLLQKLLHEYRPYEINPGQTDQLYEQCLERIVVAIEAGGGKPLVKTMQWVAGQFEALPVDRSEPRPLIGLVGEMYMRFATYSNQGIIRQVEAAGGEMMVSSMMEWFYFTNWSAKTLSRDLRNYSNFLSVFLTDQYQQYQENKLVKTVEHLLKHPHETPISRLMDNIRPYYEPGLGTEAVVSMGKAIDFAQRGLDGILNVMPFSCMPGIITAGMAPRLRADLDNIPWLDVIYDSQQGTNIRTRLEAFMYQAAQFQQRNK